MSPRVKNVLTRQWKGNKSNIFQRIFGNVWHIYFNFYPGFLQDNKVEPEEEANQVCNRPEEPGGDGGGSQEWAGHRMLTLWGIISIKPLFL